MLGEIVQRVEATPIRAFLRREFFEPLGLADTSLGTRKRNARESDVKIHSGEYGGEDAVSWNWNSDYWRGFGAPWGGLLTTATELTALCQAFLYDGALNGNRILNPAAVGAMTMDQTSAMPDLTRADRLRQRWGFGWRLRDRVSSVFGDLTSDATFGHEGATGTVAWVDPRTETTCVLLTNDPHGAATVRPRVCNAVATAVT